MKKPGESPEATAKRLRLARFMETHEIESLQKWANAAGVREGAIRNFRDRPGASMKASTISKLARAAHSTEAELMAAISGDKYDPAPNTVASANLSMQPLLGSQVGPTGDQDLPILGHVKGGSDAFFIDNGEISGVTMRPNILKGVPDAYAVEVYDDSMAPAFKHGFLAWVHPRKPVKPGNDVVVQLKDGQALIKELVRRTDKELTLRQHNPGKDLKIPSAKVKSIHLIVGGLRIVT